MILANGVTYPHIAWVCQQCGGEYLSRGRPPERRCVEGHSAGWLPKEEKIHEYIEILESLDVGDGVLVCGMGPAPLMGPIEEVGENYIITESLDYPSKKIRWDSEEPKIEWKVESASMYDPVYHIEEVEVRR